MNRVIMVFVIVVLSFSAVFVSGCNIFYGNGADVTTDGETVGAVQGSDDSSGANTDSQTSTEPIEVSSEALPDIQTDAAPMQPDECLSTPKNLFIDEIEYLHWDAVSNAVGYIVSDGENEFIAETNSLDIFTIASTPNKIYRFSVRALGDGVNYAGSSFSECVEYSFGQSEDLFYFKENYMYGGYSVFIRDPKALVGKIVIPYEYNGMYVTTIGSLSDTNAYKFGDCPNLTGVIIPNTVKAVLTQNAFDNCPELRRVSFSARMISIPTFQNCPKLCELSLPLNIESVPKNFLNGTGSAALKLSPDHPTLRLEAGCLIYKADNRLCAMIDTNVIPGSVEIVENVKECEELIVSNGVKLIKELPKSLKRIELPGTVETIGAFAFANCVKLESIVFGEGLKKIENGAFKNCKSIKALAFPASLEDIDPRAFSGMDALESITFPAEGAHLYIENGCIVTAGSPKTLVYGNMISEAGFPEGIEVIGNNAFQNIGFENLIIPHGVHTIAERAFNKCSAKTVVISPTVIKIGRYAFYDFVSDALIISEGVSVITEGAFRNMVVKKISLPQSLKVIEKEAFDSAARVSYLSLPRGIQSISDYALNFFDSRVAMLFPRSILSVGSGNVIYSATAYFDFPESMNKHEWPSSWNSGGMGEESFLFGSWFAQCTLGRDSVGEYVESIYLAYGIYGECLNAYITPDGAIAPQREGYTFGGFAESEGGEAVILPVEKSFVSPTTGETETYLVCLTSEQLASYSGRADTRLYAVWIKNIES